MQAALKLTARVLPGNRIEMTVPELKEGTYVEVLLVLSEMQTSTGAGQPTTMLDLLNTLPKSPKPRAFDTWEEYERFLREEKDAWDR